MPQLTEAISRLVASYVQGKTFADIQFGTVLSEHPLVIEVNEKLRLTEEFITLAEHLTNYDIEYELAWDEMDHLILDGNPVNVEMKYVQRGKMLHKNCLRVGDRVVLSRLEGGQMYVAIERVGQKKRADWPKPMLPSDSEKLDELLYGDTDWEDPANLNALIELLDKYFRGESSLSKEEMEEAKKKLRECWKPYGEKYATGRMRGFTNTSDPILQHFLDLGVDMPDYMNNVDGSIISWEEKERLAYYWSCIRDGKLTQRELTNAACVEQLARIIYAEQTKWPYNQAEGYWVMINRMFDKSWSGIDNEDLRNLGNIMAKIGQFTTYEGDEGSPHSNALTPPKEDLVWNNAKLLASYAYAIFGDDEARANGGKDGGLTVKQLQEKYALMMDQDSATKAEVYDYYAQKLMSLPDINGVPIGAYHNRGVRFYALKGTGLNKIGDETLTF